MLDSHRYPVEQDSHESTETYPEVTIDNIQQSTLLTADLQTAPDA